MKLFFAINVFLAFFSSVVAEISQETSIADEAPIEASGKIRASHQKPHSATLFLPEEEILEIDLTDVDFWEEPDIAETFTERVLRGLGCGSEHRTCCWKHGCKYCKVCTCWDGCYWKKMSYSCGGRYSGDDKWYGDDKNWGW
mmetsp:Transcript_4862/g.7168  ORF Transcript_4862/g.7168 Transcript_4862/m.7168 type:complete len:142 (+) Transcript_4862:132-557(+)